MCEVLIDVISEEEKKAAADRYMKLSKKAAQLTEEERNFIFDSGYFNSALRGYMILAMQGAGFTKENIRKAVDELHYVLDTTSVKEAYEVEL